MVLKRRRDLNLRFAPDAFPQERELPGEIVR